MKTYIEPNETTLMEKAATNLRDRLLIRMLSHLGCRISEVLGLTVQDIDFHQGTVTIQHLKARLKLSCPHCSSRLGRSHQFCPKCGLEVKDAVARESERHRLRTLPVDGETLEVLKGYIDRGGLASHGGKQLIFGINRHRAWQVVRECARKAGLGSLQNPETGRLRGVSPHRLRDGFAVMAVQRDDSTDSIRMLQEWLGHANIGTTMRYRKVAGQELKDWYEKLWPRKEGSNG
ncbi:MAG: site-specific integrase [Chloroflexi bacterium]|nr:site-specific integrase [Chloroflexota bacterium]